MMKEESKTFQEFLLKKGVIKQKDILAIEVARKDTNVSLGAIALNRGLLTSVEIRHVLDVQSKTAGKFGEVAIELKCKNSWRNRKKSTSTQEKPWC